jgi:predicted enzyme related to lactoylglutathione lyase
MSERNGYGHMPPNWSVDFWIDDADAAVGRVDELGGAVIAPPSDPPRSGRR